VETLGRQTARRDDRDKQTVANGALCSSTSSRTWSILRAPRAQYRCSIVSETL
jgi:hypothetical protein